MVQYKFKLLKHYLDVKANIKCALKTNKPIISIILSLMTYDWFK